jgi:hypothetical protein
VRRLYNLLGQAENPIAGGNRVNLPVVLQIVMTGAYKEMKYFQRWFRLPINVTLPSIFTDPS